MNTDNNLFFSSGTFWKNTRSLIAESYSSTSRLQNGIKLLQNFLSVVIVEQVVRMSEEELARPMLTTSAWRSVMGASSPELSPSPFKKLSIDVFNCSNFATLGGTAPRPGTASRKRKGKAIERIKYQLRGEQIKSFSQTRKPRLPLAFS